ncbi:hypothetical protein LG325_03010 [Marinobacter nauticus]
MQNNKLRMAIRATAAVAAFGMATQASAIELSAGGYDANLYGFARAVATYDIDENLAQGGQSANLGAITTDGSDTADGHFGIDANTSRIGLSVVSPEDVKVVLEMDFDNDDTLKPRLRHAYGEYNNVLIGQYWSNYNSFVGNTSSLDFDGVPGLAGTQGRAGQIRYTTGPVSFSLENPDNDVADGTTKSSTPALTAKLEDSAGGFSYSAAAMVKQTSYDDAATGGGDDSAISYAAFVAGKVAITDMISIQGAINYGEGAGGYVWRSGGNYGLEDGYVDNGDLETFESMGGALGVSMNLGSGSSVNAGYGMATVDLDDAVDAGVMASDTQDTNSMAFVNYQWTPVNKVKMGVEYAYVETETQAGDSGDANRLMFLAQYSF